MISRDEMVKRALRRREVPGDYWDWLAGMIATKPGIGIGDRRHYNQRQWNALQQAKSALVEAWE